MYTNTKFDPSILLFIHIPKTGGMSIRELLKDTLFYLEWGNRHLSSTEISNRLSKQLYDKLFKFTVVRNPYDRIVSYYYFMQTDDTHPEHIRLRELTLSEYVDWACDFNLSTQFMQISIEGRLAVDCVLRFENLAEGWLPLAKQFGLPLELPHVNKSEHEDWEQELTEEDKCKIYNSFEVDFRMLCYDE